MTEPKITESEIAGVVCHAIRQLLDEASPDGADERRTEPREPCFAAATIERLPPHDATPVMGFTWNISSRGVGLLHRQALAEEETVRVTVHQDDGGNVLLFAKTVWCKPFTSEWYLSGAILLTPSSGISAEL